MPPGVVVSMLSVSDTSPIFSRSRSSAVAINFLSERARRSSFQTTSVSPARRSEEHTSELQTLMRISYAVFCLKQKNTEIQSTTHTIITYEYITTLLVYIAAK